MFTLNHGFKGHRPQRHFGEPLQPVSGMHNDYRAVRRQLRQTFRARRAALPPEQQAQAAQQLCRRLLNLPAIIHAHHIALFYALPREGEPDTRPLIDALWAAGKTLYLPRLHPFSRGHLLFQRFTSTTPLIPNKLGIPEPRLDVRTVVPFAALDVVLTPLVAFDESGQRLGMGGGYYDRTLRHWQHHQVLPIGVAHDCQHTETLPAACWDVPLPIIVTPSRVWQYR